MSDFSTTSLNHKVLDPHKRVRYSMGLVLGVDEFVQEQTYLRERDHLHQEALHGYGTVRGLNVTRHVGPEGPEILVQPGLAVDVLGRSICVDVPQCARLNAWLRRHDSQVRDRFGSLPDSVSLYVVLCFRECETDIVPVPGGPCRPEEDSQTASRIADKFDLKLALDPPEHNEENAVRAFGRLLRSIRITDEGPFVTLNEFLEYVRAIGDEMALVPEAGSLPENGSPPEPGSPPEDGSPPEPGSLPEGGDALHIHPDDADAILRAAFAVWVSEVRPRLVATQGCRAVVDDACVLLARVDVDVVEQAGFLTVETGGTEANPVIHPNDRPYLLTTRLLQEWLTSHPSFSLLPATGSPPEPGPSPAPGSPPEGPSALNDLIDVEAAPTESGEVLGWDDATGTWVAADHGDMVGLEDDDHPQYLATSGSRAMSGNLDVGGNQVINLASATADGEAVPFEQAVKNGDAAGGDLGGSYPNPAVSRLRGRDITDAEPNTGDVLIWNGSAWAPAPAPSGGTGETNLETDLTRIVALSWLHGQTSPGLVPVQLLNGNQSFGFVVGFGKEELDDEGRVVVDRGSLDEDSFRILAERPEGGSFWTYLGLRPQGVIPVRAELDGFGVIAQARQIEETTAAAAAFLFSAESLDQFGQVRLEVVIKGDFIMDETGRRAIDAEYLRADLPGGDRPAASSLGIQGGRFESWFVRGRARININEATVDELRSLPRIGPVLAERIVERRDEVGRFSSLENLLDVEGIGESLLNDIRPFVTV